jgi:hypothetical protein
VPFSTVVLGVGFSGRFACTGFLWAGTLKKLATGMFRWSPPFCCEAGEADSIKVVHSESMWQLMLNSFTGWPQIGHLTIVSVFWSHSRNRVCIERIFEEHHGSGRVFDGFTELWRLNASFGTILYACTIGNA